MPVKEGWAGRYFDDFTVGDIYRSRIGRTISDADNTQFTLLTNNTNQIHFNEHYASDDDYLHAVLDRHQLGERYQSWKTAP